MREHGRRRADEQSGFSMSALRHSTRNARRMTRTAVAVFGALLVTAALPGLVEPATGAVAPTAATGATPAAVRASLRNELENYLHAYGDAEHISAVSLAVTIPGRGPDIDIAVGSTRYGGRRAVSPDALWQIGSNTKAFTSVLVLQLEAEHVLSINDTLGKWLPQYAAWKDVTIKRLLNMTSGIGNYTGSVSYWNDVAAAPNRTFSPSQLVSYAAGLPATHGYSYSNTNYILAQMIVERASHQSYARRLREHIIKPLRLRDTFYATDYRRAVTARMPAGYWFIPQLPMMSAQLGQDQRRLTVSWAQGAGAIVGSLQDLGKWDRALFNGRVLPRQQQRELTSLVSTTTGAPITSTSLSDPAGYGLGVSQVTSTALGTKWYYEGETDGYRVVNIYAPQSGTAIVIGVNSATLDDHTAALGTSVFQILHKAGLS
jgi:D-alanyl-D-alanine carboxypeptidase